VTYEIDEDYIAHYGTLRKSGRYPWGSGGTPQQNHKSFLGMVAEMERQGLSQKEIVEGMGMESTTQLRALKSRAKAELKAADIAFAHRLKYDKGYSNVEIGKRFNPPLNESSVRALLAPAAMEKVQQLTSTSEMLKRQVDEHGFVDIGTGVENHIGVSKERLGVSLAMLKEQGYEIHTVQVDQLGSPGNKTLVKTLCKPGTTYQDAKANRYNIQTILEKSDDGGRSFLGMVPPLSLNPNRVAINYAEDGGAKADGVMYVRPGKDDLSLRGAHYAQVRVKVGDKHYLKGMAIYKDDLPDGVDVVFNTNKKREDIGDNKLDAMKKLKDDPDNPFGAVVDQIKVQLPDGSHKATSVMNLVNEEGDWGEWSKSLSTQMLSKQSPKLAKDRLDETFRQKREDLDEIMSLTNPAVKKKLLEEYADSADASSVHLKAAALPRQASQVILPVPTMPQTQVYAPNYKNGERVVLVRYPHGGTFEIPELTVNNNHPDAKRLIGPSAKDAIGISHKVAERLSGADFDGDTVLVIPNNANRVKTTPPLEKLKGFDPQRDYKPYDGMKTIDGGVYNARTKEVEYGDKGPSGRGKGTQMGLVSNLITDMTIMGAGPDELARAVRHSMVVIDAEKHVLNYTQSAKDNGIPALMKKYQNRSQGGAASLISRATSPKDVNARKRFSIDRDVDPETGKKVFRETGESWVDAKTGQTVFRTQKSTKLAETDDARTLVSKADTKIEDVYATHSNRLKALANEARKEYVGVTTQRVSPSAKQVYTPEVQRLNAALNVALKNRPRERQAQILANGVVALKKEAQPFMEKAELKKIEAQALAEARIRTGARKEQIVISDKEWDAIQAGAIAPSKLKTILDNADMERVRELATPRATLTMTNAKTARAASLLASGLTQAEVATILGVSLTTLKTGLKGDGDG
jgi:hypothetical protein